MATCMNALRLCTLTRSLTPFSAQDRLYMAASINGGRRTWENQKRTTEPREATGKLSHIPTLAEPETQTHADRGETAEIGAQFYFGTHCMGGIPLVKHSCAPLILQQQSMKKHWTIRWRKERANKFYKVNLPDFDEIRERETFTPDERRIWMKKEGICQPRTFTRPMYISNTNSVFEPYVPPEGDGKASSLSKEGASERFTELKEKGKSYKELRKVRQYEDNFDTTSFAELANNVYIETHNLLQDVKKNENRLLELVTEKAYPEMTFGLDNKTLQWKFVESIEPPRVVHIRTNPMITKDNIYAQITVRFHSKQVLALYDRFGRLMYGSEHLVKDVLDYVVFEKHIASLYGSWRIHGKIIPKWLPPREPLLKTYRRPNLNLEEIVDAEEEKEKTDKKEDEENDEINEALEKQKKKYNVEIV